MSMRYVFTYEFNPALPVKPHAAYVDTVLDDGSVFDRNFLGAFATEEEAAHCLANTVHPDVVDCFHGSRSIKDREPLDADFREFIDLANAYYGKSPMDLPIEVRDRLVREVLYGEQHLDEEQNESRDKAGLVDWSGLYNHFDY